ncbi:hypothetical protein [Olsenella uli]|nr:hypothetical protein [Olsenella uli]
MPMLINVTALKETVGGNRQLVGQQAQECQSQIDRLNGLSTEPGVCDSAAYRSMFEYLRRVKIPALMQQSVFLDAYAADMQVDLERLAELETDGSGVIDTDELANRIVSLQRVNDELSRWISSNGEQNPDACNYAIQVMQGNQDSVARFQQQLDKALAYASDSSIYSSSSTEMDVLGEASAAM